VKMGSFFTGVLMQKVRNPLCLQGESRISKMGSFGNILFLQRTGFTRIGTNR
jgi:hypothetical protein